MTKYALNGQIIVDFFDKWQSKKDQFLLVYYENLVRYTKSEADRIFNFLGLNPNLVTEEQLKSLPIIGSSTNTGGEDKVHWQPVYHKSDFNPLARSQHWSSELHQQFADICGEVSFQLGYDLNTNLPIAIPGYSPTNQSSRQNQSPSFTNQIMNLAFIFGIRPRSGTTFLQTLINSHPYCEIADEPYEDYLIPYSDSLVTYAEELSNYWNQFQSISKPEKSKARILEALGKGLATLRIKNNSQMIYITKTPSIQKLDNFFHLFPNNKLIIILRNGKDLVESTVKSFNINDSFDNDYQTAMNNYYNSSLRIIDFIKQWRSKQDQFLLVYYENLVRYTKSEADRIFTFLEVDPNLVTEEQLKSLPIIGSSTNRGGEDKVHWRAVYDKSDFNPLARSQDWSEELHQKFQDICGEVSRQLGYDLETNLPISVPDYSLNNQSSPQNQLREENTISTVVENQESITPQLSSTKIAQKITREFLRKLWFAMGEKKETQFIYRRLLESAITVKADIIGPRMDYYNETRNDRWIIEYIFPAKYNGYFLEAGAANGKDASSCYLLETEYDWRGICIEPHPDFFTELVKNRPNSICENVCLAEKDSEVIYIKGKANQRDAYLSGIKSNLEQFKHQGEEIIARGEVIRKQATTLEALLDKHKAPKIIDYGAFDIEGSELKVLEVFPFDRYTFLALSLECDGKIWKPITQLLKSKGYREVKNPFNRNKPWERYWLHSSFPL